VKQDYPPDLRLDLMLGDSHKARYSTTPGHLATKSKTVAARQQIPG